ncbi:MAG: hypothetical protein VKQ33_15995 [Candidatus Sericytochromatia bacterium]|nr:hypothetical protein [Candidatus Sericytochromatia bacterium]
MRIQKSVETTLQPTRPKAPVEDRAEATPKFDTDKFVSSQRNPEDYIGGGSGYGTSGFSSGARSR